MSKSDTPKPSLSPLAPSFPRLTPLLWACWGLSLLWTAVVSMDWWGVFYESRWLPALTLQSLWMGEGWTVNPADPYQLHNMAPSPLAPLLGRVLMLLLPSAPAALWLLSLLGAGLVGLGLLMTRWSPSSEVRQISGIWCLALWATHPLVLSSMGMGWLPALGFLAVGAALIEARWEKLGWTALGLAMLGRTEMALGWIGVLAWRRVRWRGERRSRWWALSLAIPGLWHIVAWVTFGSPWPETWRSAGPMSRSGFFGAANEYWTFLAGQVGAHPIWALFLGILALIGLLTLRHAGALAWAGAALGAGCLVIHGMRHLAGGAWWWLYLGPFLGLLALATPGLAWLLERDRPRLTRVLGVAAAVLVLFGQFRRDWLIRDWDALRAQNQDWQETAQWLRQNTEGPAVIATTQPATLIWHLGLAHRMAVRWIEALSGPLAKPGAYAPSPETDPLQQVETLNPAPDLLVLRWRDDALLLDKIWKDQRLSRRWEFLHEIPDQGWRIQIFRRREAQTAADASLEATRSAPADVAEVNRELGAAMTMPWVWGPSPEAAIRQTDDGLEISDTTGDGYLWTPWFEVPSAAVEAIEVTLQVRTASPVEATTLQIWWKGTDAQGEEIPTYQHREMLVHSDWTLRTYRCEVGSDVGWQRFHTVRRLRIDPSPSPFRATLKSVRLIPAEP
jgi:hypothetical protein